MGMYIQKFGEEKRKSDLKQIKNMMKHPALKDVSSALTFSARIKFYYLFSAHYYISNDLRNAYNSFEKEFSLYEGHPDKIKTHFHSYAACLHNLLGVSLKLKFYNEFEKYLEIIKKASLLTKNHSSKAKLFHGYGNYLLDYVIITGQFEKAIKTIPEIISGFRTYENELNPYEKTFLLANIAIVWFGAEEYHKCLFYLNKIRNELTLAVHPDAERFLHVFYLITHYELEHYDLLSSLAQSSLRALEKRNNFGKTEKIMLEFFSAKLPDPFTRQKKDSLFAVLKKRMEGIKYSGTSFIRFSYEAWIESKTTNMAYAEIYKTKAKPS
jgi:hypothetical protein